MVKLLNEYVLYSYSVRLSGTNILDTVSCLNMNILDNCIRLDILTNTFSLVYSGQKETDIPHTHTHVKI